MICAIFAGAAPKPATVDYMLEDTSGKFALYAGPAYRCFVLPKDTVSSLEDLERRVSRLPQGTKVYWMPYLREPSGTPILFSKGQFAQFEKFCREHRIELIVEGVSK